MRSIRSRQEVETDDAPPGAARCPSALCPEPSAPLCVRGFPLTRCTTIVIFRGMDERILGSGPFVARMLAGAGSRRCGLGWRWTL